MANEAIEEQYRKAFPPTLPFPPPPPPPRDWYDGYDHQLPPPPPFPPHKHPCPNCRPKDLDKYGFVPIVGEKYYTSVSGKACCPAKVTITKITATTIFYEDKSGTPNQKSYHDFMTSSWKDRSL